MKLTLRLLVVFVAITLGVLGVNAYLRIDRAKELSRTDMRKDALAKARTLAGHVEFVVNLPQGVEKAAALVRFADEAAMGTRVRWVSLEDGASTLDRPVVPLRDLEPVRKDETSFRRLSGAGAGWLVTYAPVRGTPGEPLTAIEIQTPLAEQQASIHSKVRRTLARSAVLLAIAAGAAALFGAAFVGRPLRKLRIKARRAGSGDFSEPLVLRRRDELGELANELNTMCEHLAEGRRKVEEAHAARIAALEEVRRADRLATVGQLSAGVAHEIGTPLGVIAGRAKMIATGELQGDEGRDSARIVAEQAQRIAGIIRQLLDFSRKRPLESASVELVPLVRSIVDLLDLMAQKRGVTLASAGTPPDGARVFGDAGQLQQVVTNLLVNAIQATGRGGKVELSLLRGRRRSPNDHGAEAEWIGIAVRDNGSGIDPQTMKHVFEPFFTTKGVGEGTGLGLAVTHGIVQEHGGWIDVESEVGKGSQFTLYLPCPAGGGG